MAQKQELAGPASVERERAPTMDRLTELLRWAKDQGVELHGIEPQALLGRGIGIVATEAIEVPGALLLQVPTKCLRTVDTIPSKITSAFPKDAPVHGLLAAHLTLDTSDTFSAWNAVVPTRADVWSSLPLTWDPALVALLPRAARDLLAKQRAKWERDWAQFQAAAAAVGGAGVSRDDHLYHWLLVNTRTFYHDAGAASGGGGGGGGGGRRHRPREDRMVLQPVADLFNHADTGCVVAFDAAAFTITADRAYATGDEVRICYGRHPNDFLLVEYGFVLATPAAGQSENRWDEVCIDDVVLPELSARQRETLDEVGFLGGYMLDASTVCYRTQVALRLLLVSPTRWRAFVDGEDGEQDDESVQHEVDETLVRILKRYLVKIDRTLGEVGGLEVGQPSQRKLLALRWRQVRQLVNDTIMRLQA